MAPSVPRIGSMEKQGENWKYEESGSAGDRLGLPIPPLQVDLSGAFKNCVFVYLALIFSMYLSCFSHCQSLPTFYCYCLSTLRGMLGH